MLLYNFQTLELGAHQSLLLVLLGAHLPPFSIPSNSPCTLFMNLRSLEILYMSRCLEKKQMARCYLLNPDDISERLMGDAGIHPELLFSLQCVPKIKLML